MAAGTRHQLTLPNLLVESCVMVDTSDSFSLPFQALVLIVEDEHTIKVSLRPKW